MKELFEDEINQMTTMPHQPSKSNEREEVESRFVKDFRAGKFINQTTGLQNPFEIEKWWNAERARAVEEARVKLIKEVEDIIAEFGDQGIDLVAFILEQKFHGKKEEIY